MRSLTCNSHTEGGFAHSFHVLTNIEVQGDKKISASPFASSELLQLKTVKDHPVVTDFGHNDGWQLLQCDSRRSGSKPQTLKSGQSTRPHTRLDITQVSLTDYLRVDVFYTTMVWMQACLP